MLTSPGVNTGFGGSADATTSSCYALQTALLQMQLSAVLPVSDSSDATTSLHQSHSTTAELLATLAMPESWVRGAIFIRCHSLLRGHSAVRLQVIKALMKLLEHDIVPLVPLRGSISASGDLCPLSYVAGTLEGNTDVHVWSGPPGSRILIPASKALKSIGMDPIIFGPKETLGVLNGTAFSVSVATICHQAADTLMVLVQILTAMSVEALLGTVESFDPFIATIRPHSGQIEVSRNIRAFLTGSKLASKGQEQNSPDGELRQDRYALRTSSQWLGPVLEDLSLARQQLNIELNSTTDNPVVDTPNRKIYHGGNFQASSISSSTEKTRMCLDKIGKLIFAQSTELLDHRLAYNLPPNLVADEPSLSYTMKGVDINMAAYYSELSYVVNPVSNHVQSAEMSNQGINSLALVSARATHTAVDLVSLMSATYIYILCQALDLRAMDRRFLETLEPEIRNLELAVLGSRLSRISLELLHSNLRVEIWRSLAATTGRDSPERFTIVARSTQYLLVMALQSSPRAGDLLLVTEWIDKLAETCKHVFCRNREEYLAAPDAGEFLGMASMKMYRFMRKKLCIPMHKGLVDHPTFGGVSNGPGKEKRVTTGTQISRVYKALREGRMTAVVMNCLNDALEVGEGRKRELGSKL
jgi:phenylalanine ammonia-lyase